MAAVDSSPEFIARAAEMALLGDALERAAAGEPSVIIIGGEAGVGKTRLLEEWAARSGDRARVLIGRCFPSSRRGLPYGPFADLYRDLERQVSPRELARILGAARDELRLLVPELDTDRRGALPDDMAEGTLAARARFLELLLGVAGRLQAMGTAVIAIDDLQWADRASLDLVGFLARGVRGGRLLLVIVVRTEDLPVGDPVLDAIGHLERTGRVRRIELRRFTRAELADQVTAIIGAAPAAALVERVLAMSDGNPFFAEELLAAMRRGEDADVPPMLDDLLRARLASVTDRTRGILRVAALAGTEIDDELVVTATGLPPEDVAAALREAAEHGLIARVGSGRVERPQFRHRLLQESIARDLLPGERRRLHAAFAEALERSPRSRLVAGETARHWALADRPDRALPAMLVAGLEAERRFAFADARRHLEEALRLADVAPASNDLELDVVGVLQHAAEDAMLSGDAPGAVSLARRALATLGDGVDPNREAGIHERLRWYLWEMGDRDGAERALEEAYRLVPDDPPSATRARVLGQLGGLRLRQGSLERASALADEAVAVARASAALPELAFALGVRGWVEAALGRPDAGLADLREALAMAEFLERPWGRALGIAMLSSLLLYVGRLEEASRTALDGLGTVRAIGLEGTFGGSLAATAAAASYLLGRWEDAHSLSTRALGIAAPGPEGAWPGVVAMRLAAGSGDEDLLRAGRELSEPFLGSLTDRIHGQWYGLAVVEAELWADRAEQAAEIASTAVRDLPRPALDEPAGWTFALAIRAVADLAAIARLTHDERRESSHRASADRLLAEWRDRRGSVAGAMPDPDIVDATEALCIAESGRAAGGDARDAWAIAAAAFERVGIPYAAAYARFREAEAILAGVTEGSPAAVRTRRSAAAVPLAAALEVANRIGARPLTAAAEQLARRARLDVRGPERAAPPAARIDEGRPADHAAAFIADRHLTPRELEVLALVASGWSNGEIASALFISRKTASVHVSNVLGKLGVADRIEAASLAQRAGLEGPPRPGSVLDELAHDDRGIAATDPASGRLRPAFPRGAETV